MIVKSKFAGLLRPQLRKAMRNYDSKFYDRRPRRIQVDWNFVLGAVLVAMWGLIIYLLWDIHTLVSLHQQSISEIVRKGLLP